ncbi:MAG: Holliday junction DNA helicase RuvA [Verrucomicrobiales bacterium]|jgi:Holliday junction DNA helicase RuvA
MITFLRGVLQDNLSSQITVDVNGVGYEVIVTLSCLDRIGAPGGTVTILTHHHIREQEQTLYGFLTAEERDLFRLLINRVSGVGPKVAMAILGGIPVEEFKAAVVSSDLVAISKIKGLGKKTAERIVLELKDKVGVTAAWEVAGSAIKQTPEQAKQNDAVLALISLGYKQGEAAKAVIAATKAGSGDLPVEELVRAALRQLQ